MEMSISFNVNVENRKWREKPFVNCSKNYHKEPVVTPSSHTSSQDVLIAFSRELLVNKRNIASLSLQTSSKAFPNNVIQFLYCLYTHIFINKRSTHYLRIFFLCIQGVFANIILTRTYTQTRTNYL